MNFHERAQQIEQALAEGGIDEEEWHRKFRDLTEAVYLSADSPYGGSGSGGDGARWERKRRVIAEAVDRDGTFLDIGCANGLLMESIAEWAAARGYRVEPYGLDIAPRLAAIARARLPQWAGRIYHGNAMTWTPPRRFDFVRTELVYVPDARQPAYVARLLRDLVAPGGRLIVCGYGDGRAAELLRSWGYAVTGEANVHYENGRVWTHVAWIDAPM